MVNANATKNTNTNPPVKVGLAFKEIPFKLIKPNPANIRKSLDGVDEGDGQTVAALAESIKAIGLKTPLTVTMTGPDQYMVTDGHRRHLALEANKTPPDAPIPCIVDQTADATSDMLVMGLARKGLHPGEVALALATIRGRKNPPTYGEISKGCGKSEGYLGALGKIGIQCGPEIVGAWISGKIQAEGANMTHTLLKVSDMDAAGKAEWFKNAQAGNLAIPEGSGSDDKDDKDEPKGSGRRFPKCPKGSAQKDLRDRLTALKVGEEALYWAVHVAAIFGGEPMSDDDFRACVKGASPKRLKTLDKANAAVDNDGDE